MGRFESPHFLFLLCIKRSVNGPDMRHVNRLPTLCGLDVMPFAELPFLQDGLAALSLCYDTDCNHQN